MKRFRLVAAVGLLLAIISAPLAYAGLWIGLPIVSGATYCSTATAGVPGTTAVCVSQAPAGPVALVGNELVPADIGTAGVTSAPTTVYIPEPLAASGAYQYQTNAGIAALVSIQVANNINNVILDATGAITQVNLTLPSAPLNGQIVRFSADQNITTLIFGTTGLAGQGVKNSPASLTTSTSGDFGYALEYVGGTVNTWFRLQ